MRAERPLRVALVPSAYYPHVGGIEEMTRRLGVELQRRGHVVLIVTNRWPSTASASEVLDGIHVRRLAFELPAASTGAISRFVKVAPRTAVVVTRLLRSWKPDVVHLMGAGPNAVYVSALRRVLPGAVVLSVHGEFRNDAHQGFDQSRSLLFALRRLLRHAAAVTAPSGTVLEEIAERLVIEAPTSVIPNAVEPDEFRKAGPPPEGLGRYVFTAGRLVEQKGIDVLLRAYARAREGLAGQKLVIAGDGPERAALARLSSELGVGDDVVFLGSVDRRRLAALMSGAEIFAFASRQEAFGLALLEAMAAGTPAVATRVGGIPEFARHGDNALLVAAEDAAELADALVALAGDAQLRARLAAAGRSQAERYAWNEVIRRWESLYAEVVGA
jgi:glycosyltransferase involved in cell wall biosynthesis